MVNLLAVVTFFKIAYWFMYYQVVPDNVSFPPYFFLKVNFDSGVSANLGNELTPTQVIIDFKISNLYNLKDHCVILKDEKST